MGIMIRKLDIGVLIEVFTSVLARTSENIVLKANTSPR